MNKYWRRRINSSIIDIHVDGGEMKMKTRARARSPRIGVRDGQTNGKKIIPFVCPSFIPTASIYHSRVFNFEQAKARHHSFTDK
jgi:hypothetical protein